MAVLDGVRAGLADGVDDVYHLAFMLTDGAFGTEPQPLESRLDVRGATTLVFYVVVMAVVLQILRSAVYPVLASALGATDREKCKIALNELGFYGYSCITHYMWYMHSNNYSWVWPSQYSELYANGHSTGWHQVPGVMRVSYFTELAWYAVGIWFLLTDFKRKDFVPMFVHHVVTLVLISYSWHTGYGRTGVVVIILHDLSDVFLQLAKICNYMVNAYGMDVAFFVGFAVTFAVPRLYWFPQLIYACYLDIPFWEGSLPSNGGALYGMLCILVVLHCYWFVLILKLAVQVLFLGGPKEDIRESEGAPATDSKKRA